MYKIIRQSLYANVSFLRKLIFTQRRPSPTTAIQISIKQPKEHTFITLRQEANFQGESIPGRGTNNGECSALPGCNSSTRHQKLVRNCYRGTKCSSTRCTRYRITELAVGCGADIPK